MKKFYFCVLLMFCSLLFGQLQWQDGGVPVNVNYPLFWYNSGGNVIGENTYFVWSESFSGNPDLYLQGYDQDGNQIWDEHLLICDAPKYQGRGEVIAADNDNLIVAWQDSRNIPGLYFGEGYEIYMQKISPEGEHLWQQEIVLPEECHAYDFDILPDSFGGCYISYNTIAWHFNSDGEIYPGWGDGIIVSDNYYSYENLVDNDGNLVVMFNEGDSCYVSKISPLGQFEWEHLQIANFYMTPDNIYSSENTVTVIAKSGFSFYMQQISENGEIWDEPLEIYSGNSNITNLYTDIYSSGYYILACEYESGWRMFNISFEGDIIWNNPVTCGSYFEGLHSLENDNFRLWQRTSDEFILLEFDNNADMVSPQNGWLQFELPEYSWSTYISTFAGNHSTAVGCRYCPLDSDDEILKFQIIDEFGQLVCGDDFAEISRGKNDHLLVDKIFKVNDFEVVIFQTSYAIDYELIMKIFDEDGNQIDDTMNISPENIEYAHPLQVIGNRLYFANETEVDFQPYLYINAVEFNEEPQIVWENEGLYLGAGGFSNNEINITQIPQEENTLLFTWTQECPYGNTQIQKMVDDQFIWQSGGITFPCQNGETHRAYAYQDYILQMISWGNGYYLNRVDSDGNPLWDNELMIAGDYCAGKPLAIPQENGNMHFIRGEFITNGLALIEHRITPEGESLSGEQGDVICFLNDEHNINIKPLENSYAVVTQTGEGLNYSNFRFRRFDYDGEQIGEMIELEHDQYTDLNTIDFINENLAVTYSGGYGSSNLQVVDFDGNPSELLPQNPYEFCELSNYPVPTFTCSDENSLYFCWVDCYSSERPDEGEYGWNWYMQKFTIPVLENHENEIISKNLINVYPNPFNPELNISWEKEYMQSDYTEIEIFNIKGQRIRYWKTPAENEKLVWNGKNENGKNCSSGIYYVKFISGEKNIVHKTILLK